MRSREDGGKEKDRGATTVTVPAMLGREAEENGRSATWWDPGAGGCNWREVHSRWGIPLTERFLARNLHPVHRPLNDGDCTRPFARPSMQRRSRPSICVCLCPLARGGRESAADAATLPTLEPERGSSD